MFGQQIPHADVVFLNRHYAQAQSPAYASAHRAFLLVLTRLAPPHALLAAYLWLRGTVLSMINGITFRVVDTQVDQDEHDLVPADDIRSFRGQRVHAARLEAHKPKNCFRRHYVNRRSVVDLSPTVWPVRSASRRARIRVQAGAGPTDSPASRLQNIAEKKWAE
ncbi:hypothetical protein F5888DRAFT_1635028 [Russula emetica]|nr:hypothetical protein F5888DRAFT_1635028 [Russula emetica]